MNQLKLLIQHLVSENMKEIAAKSLLHCHTKNLHSIMLLESPGKTIRLYVAEEGNELYKNAYPGEYSMPLAYHPHHCNLTLHVVCGRLDNITVAKAATGRKVKKFLYQSAITEGKGAFIARGVDYIRMKNYQPITQGNSVFMNAGEIHTVATDPDKLTAWLVYEGKEDKKYKPYCWSNHDLTNISMKGLYKKAKESEIKSLLTLSGLL